MRRIIICIIAILLVLSLASCGKGEDNPLVGTWIDKDRDTLTLNKDGSYQSTHYYDSEGTWKVEDDILTFKTPFKELSKKYKIEEEGDYIYLSFDETDLFGNKKDRQFVKEK